MASLESAAVALRYVYPITIFAYFAVSTVAVVFTLQNHNESKRTGPGSGRNRVPVLGLLGVFLTTHIVQLAIILVGSTRAGALTAPDHVVVGHLSCVLMFGLQLGRLLESPPNVWYPFWGSWILALPFESVITASLCASKSGQFLEARVRVGLALGALRCLVLTLLISLAFFRHTERGSHKDVDEERQPLINKDPEEPTSSGVRTDSSDAPATYGSTGQQPVGSSMGPTETPWQKRRRQREEMMEKRLEASGNWFNYVKDFKVRDGETHLQPAVAYLTYLIPSGHLIFCRYFSLTSGQWEYPDFRSKQRQLLSVSLAQTCSTY